MRKLGSIAAVITLVVLFIYPAVLWDPFGINNGGDGEPLRNQVTAGTTATPQTGQPPAGGRQQTLQGTGTTATSCGPIAWGPAGPAPGAFTNDSAAQVAEAVQVMRAEASRDHVTVHKFCPGDDTPNGWIVGSSWTESQGIRVTANFLPAGVCVDYDPGATQVNGTVYHTQVLNPRWSRTQIMSDGSASGLKFTVYWTPCVFTDGTPSWDGKVTTQQAPSAPAPGTSSGCPTSAQDVAARTNSNATNWKQNPQFSNGWIYAGPVIDGFDVPAGGKVDYDGGSADSGRVPRGSAFTYWCPK